MRLLGLLSLFMVGLMNHPIAQEQLLTADKTVLNLSAEARQSVPQDLLTANLTFEAIADTPSAAQNHLNGVMQKALKKAQGIKGVKVTTGAYRAYKVNNVIVKSPRQTKTEWHAQQALMLTSKDSETLLDIVSKLQEDDFALNNLNYMVSRELYDETRQALLLEAMGNLRKQANTLASSLDKKSVHFAQVNANQGSYYPRPERMMMKSAMMDSEAMAAPVAAAGETNISVSVNATVFLH